MQVVFGPVGKGEGPLPGAGGPLLPDEMGARMRCCAPRSRVCGL